MRVAAFHPAVGQLWETMAPTVLTVTNCLHTRMLKASCDTVLLCCLGLFFLRRKQRSLYSSAAGTLVKKDEFSSIFFQVSWLTIQPVSASPYKRANYLLIAKVE